MTNEQGDSNFGLRVETYTRKPFDVKAIQITIGNVNEVAKWCGGTVEEAAYKVMGRKTMLPCIKIAGNGPMKGRMVTALLNNWIVEYASTFRVYREKSFDEAYDQKTEAGFEVRQYVRVTNIAAAQFGRVGQVVGLEPDLIEVDFESYNDNGTKFHPSEIEPFDPTKAL